MDATLKTRWVEALRSGQYEQTTDYQFRDPDRKNCFCAMGVLANLIDPGNWDGTNWGEDVCLPDMTLQAIGLTYEVQSKVMHMNDGEELSFAEIANYIEENA